MSFFPVATKISDAYNKIENNLVQDLIIPVAGTFILVGGVVDLLTSPVRYALYKTQKKVLPVIVSNPLAQPQRKSVREVLSLQNK